MYEAAKANTETTISQLKSMAESGNYYAQLFLGSRYQNGQGVTQNHIDAFKWYRQASLNGHFGAMTFLAFMYRDGLGPVKENSPKIATEWLKCAATGGGKSAQHFLGLQYATGKGVFENLARDRLDPNGENLIKAHMWLNLAASQNYPSASARDKFAAQMSRKALKKAQRLASNWVKRKQKCRISNEVQAQAGIQPASENSFKVQVAPELVCRATIAAIMGREPDTIKVTKFVSGIVYTSYLRPNDGTRWSNRCRIDGNRVIWATDTGRWRTHALDPKITYSVLLESEEIEIVEEISPSNRSKTRYKLDRFGSSAVK